MMINGLLCEGACLLIMKKLLHNRNFYLVLALIVVALIVLIAGRLIDFTPKNLPALTPTEAPSAAIDPAATDAPPAEKLELVAKGYVCITVSGESRWFELPTEEDVSMTLSREEMINVIRLSTEGVVMHSSTCDNQACVEQGWVTLENKDKRVLQNMILCLPHEISIELYSQEEMAQLLAPFIQQ